ncbi:MAG TPA: VCBS repeat-containing protein, partial [Acidobacteriota bacterium]|nr:VCBS repeat-containing protein [Acidobacteriota bacterium]
MLRSSCLVILLLLTGSGAVSTVDAATAQELSSSGHAKMVALLAEIGRTKPLGFQVIEFVEQLRREVAASADSTSPVERAAALSKFGAFELTTDLEGGIERLEQAWGLLPGLSGQERATVGPAISFWMAVGNLRQAMSSNCVELRIDAACVLAAGPAGRHRELASTEAALGHLVRLLRNIRPQHALHSAAKWLANIAYMQLGRYPGGVPEGLAISPTVFETDEGFPRFENVAAAAGLDTYDHAGGAIVDDFDNDGYLDVVSSTQDSNELLSFFRNQGDGSFAELTESANLVGIFGGLNINQADYDNDGDLDILVLRGAWLQADGLIPNSLLRNNGDLTFTDVTFDAGLADANYPTQTAAWADYDNDGDLDLFVGNESTDEQVSPSQLFRNDGRGSFEDVAEQAGVLNLRPAKGVAWGDYDGDRFPDLYVANLDGDNRLYRNNRDNTFTDVAPELGVTRPVAGFSTWFWDVDNNGTLDLLVNNYGVPLGYRGPRVSPAVASLMGEVQAIKIPRLYLGDGGSSFREAAAPYGIDQSTLPMGSNYGDLDNDGYLDYFLGTGYPGYEALLPNVMYRNVGGKRFANVTYAGGFGHLAKGHAVAFADIDNDGDQDVFQQLGGFYPDDAYFNALYENPSFGNHWITVKLVGTQSNRAAIGARIRLEVEEDG